MTNICDACGEREIVLGLRLGTYPGAQPACQECYDKWLEDCEQELADKKANEEIELASAEFEKQIEIIINKAGMKLIETKIAETGSKYLLAEKLGDNYDTYITIRLADHSDAYGTSDINVNTPGGNNLDGIDILQLADRLQEF